jgi:hypothetical protein
MASRMTPAIFPSYVEDIMGPLLFNCAFVLDTITAYEKQRNELNVIK